MAIYIPAKPARSAAYLAFIRTLPCLICNTQRGVEAAHMPEATGCHGMGVKPSDLRAVPLCWRCHREGTDSHHKLGKRWAAHHRVDLEAVIERLNGEWFGNRD